MWGIWSYGQQKIPLIFKTDSSFYTQTVNNLSVMVRNDYKNGDICLNGLCYPFKIINNRIVGKYPYEIELDHNRHVISIYNRKTKLMTRVKVISKPFQLTNTITN